MTNHALHLILYCSGYFRDSEFGKLLVQSSIVKHSRAVSSKRPRNLTLVSFLHSKCNCEGGLSFEQESESVKHCINLVDYTGSKVHRKRGTSIVTFCLMLSTQEFQTNGQFSPELFYVQIRGEQFDWSHEWKHWESRTTIAPIFVERDPGPSDRCTDVEPYCQRWSLSPLEPECLAGCMVHR